MERLRPALCKAASSSGYAAMNLITFPYYRFFRQNTLLPILAIANAAKIPNNDSQLTVMLASWRDRKLHELYFIQVAGTLLSAAVIGCFSWEARVPEHWIGPAARYCSLVLSLFAILLSASQSFIFTTLARRNARFGSGSESYAAARDVAMVCYATRRYHPSSSQVATAKDQTILPLTETEKRDSNGCENDKERGRGQRLEGHGSSLRTTHTIEEYVEVNIRWNMVFTWQAPMMLLAYSVVAFLVGLTVYICTPLYTKGFQGKEAAIFYLVSLGVGGLCFIWCSFWAYKFVDLDEP